MSRTIGAKNKAKFIDIELFKLCQTLQENTMIPVEISFAKALKFNSSNVNPISDSSSSISKPTKEEEKISFTIS